MCTSLAAAAVLPFLAAGARVRKPNFIVVLCDDLGYGDVGVYGGKAIATPHIDRMAREGVRLTDYHAPAKLCTPSRAGLLTGRYAIRMGLAHYVILPNDQRGLPTSEVTIARALKPDYTSALIGKWHLGHVAPFWPPTRYGFDLFFGLPYSHDMLPLSLYEANGPGVELTREDVDYPELQQRFFARAERFIEANRGRPFFLNLALSAPHHPQHPRAAFLGQSRAADYGDVVEEIDSIMGRLLTTLKQLELERDTLVIFTSDNGPSVANGSAGLLRERKGRASWDGGYRVPFIAWQPGFLPAGASISSIAMGIDLLPTFCRRAGMPLPAGVLLDGKDITDVLRHGAPSPHSELLLFHNEDVSAIRTDRWKFLTPESCKNCQPYLYDERADIAENYNLAARYPDVVADLQQRFDRARRDFAPMRKGDPLAPKASQ